MNFLRRLQFNLWYFKKPPWDSGITPPELYEFIQAHPAGRAIDLGCGTGTNVITLAKAGWQVTGVDFASHTIRMAKQKTRHAGIAADLRVGDVTQLNLNREFHQKWAGHFDLVLDIGCFHGVEHRAAYLDQLTHILAPGGFWLMYGFLAHAPHQPGTGLAAADLDMIPARGLALLSRKDGLDRREQSSGWFLYWKE